MEAMEYYFWERVRGERSASQQVESGEYFAVVCSGLVTDHESFTLQDGSILELVVAGGKTFLYHEVTDRLM